MSSAEKHVDDDRRPRPLDDNRRADGDNSNLVRVAGRDYLTAARLAEILGVTCRTLHRWDALRVGPPKIKIGRTVLYDAAKIPTWLESRESKPVRLAARGGAS